MARKKILTPTQVVPSYSDILRVPSKNSAIPATNNAEEKRSKAYHIRSTTIDAVQATTSNLRVPIGDFVDFLLTEGLKALEEGRLEVPVSQGKNRIILS